MLQWNAQQLEVLFHMSEEQVSPSNPAARSSFEKMDFGSYFCEICNQIDVPENLHGRGTFHATKRMLNLKTQVKQLTFGGRWR